jgi:hypothetical protein
MLFPPEAQKEVGVEARQLVTMMHQEPFFRQTKLATTVPG